MRGDKGAEEANGYGGSMENFVDALQRTISAQKSRSSSTLGAGHGESQSSASLSLPYSSLPLVSFPFFIHLSLSSPLHFAASDRLA